MTRTTVEPARSCAQEAHPGVVVTRSPVIVCRAFYVRHADVATNALSAEWGRICLEARVTSIVRCSLAPWGMARARTGERAFLLCELSCGVMVEDSSLHPARSNACA